MSCGQQYSTLKLSSSMGLMHYNMRRVLIHPGAELGFGYSFSLDNDAYIRAVMMAQSTTERCSPSAIDDKARDIATIICAVEIRKDVKGTRSPFPVTSLRNDEQEVESQRALIVHLTGVMRTVCLP